MDGEDDHSQSEGLSTRPPEEKDLVALCGELNRQGARYVVAGGFAIIAGGYPRFTSDIDLSIS